MHPADDLSIAVAHVPAVPRLVLMGVMISHLSPASLSLPSLQSQDIRILRLSSSPGAQGL